MMFSIAGMNVFAASTTQDGLEVSLTTDKEAYSKDEKITATLSVKNTNESDVTDIAMETVIPDGYEVTDGTKNNKQLNKLAPNESTELKVAYVAKDSGEDSQDSETSQVSQESQNSEVSTVSPSNDSPKTGDNAIMPVAIAIVLLISVLLAILCFKSKKGRKLLSIILTVSMISGSSALISLKTNAVNENTKTINLNTKVNADDRKVTISAKVSYNIALSETKELCMVTFESNGGSDVTSISVPYGSTISVPEVPIKEGYIFVGWYTSNEFDKKFDFLTVPIKADVTLFAKWIKIDETSDSDLDGLPDVIEIKLGTDITKEDTDGDGLSDYFEVISTWTDPLNIDTDGNGTGDEQEDFDKDGLNNLEEKKSNTNPYVEDTDKDGLNDYEEVKKYNTNPTNPDTDGDKVSDGKEIELGTDPLVAEQSFEVSATATDEDTVTVSVDNLELSGEQVETLKVEKYNNNYFFPENMPGYIGGAYNFHVDGDFESATIRFEFDESLLDNDNFDPVIYYFNEEKRLLEELDTELTGNIASATVNHFSKYILLNRKVYQDTFEWQDVWDSTGYSNVEVVLVIDDSGSMDDNDPYNKRLEVAKNLIDKLPENNKIGIVKFASSTSQLTSVLTNNKDTAKSFLTTQYFRSSGGTNMYRAIKNAFPLFESNDEDTLKMMVVLSDGETDDTYEHSSVVSLANDNNVKIYTVGLGRSSSNYFTQYLKPLANNTAAEFYLASNADELQSIYDDINKKIDIETDSDGDGIADYYEEHMVMFNGLTIELDKNNPDSDGDNIPDGEEVVELNYQYNEDRTKVIVTGRFLSNPSEMDTDGDGLTDEEEVNYYGTSPTDADTDGDGLNDYIEVTNWFDPFEKDIDGDGRLDLQEYQEGTSPFNYDKEWYEHVGDFLYGFVLGDFIEDTDSFAVIAGQITSGCVPYVGIVADARDVIGNLVHGDYLFAGLSFAGLVPAAGDVAKASGKAVKFVGKNIDNVSKVAELIEFLEKNFPDVAKAMSKSDEFADAAKIIYSGDFLKLSKREAESIMKTFEKFGISFKAISKPSSKTLGENLIRAGKIRPNYPSAAHHIVAGSSRKAVEARAILYKFNVDINDAVNGVFLPTVKNISNAAYHPSLHTDAYYRKVTELLIQAKSKDDVIDILTDIAEQLEKGTF